MRLRNRTRGYLLTYPGFGRTQPTASAVGQRPIAPTTLKPCLFPYRHWTDIMAGVKMHSADTDRNRVSCKELGSMKSGIHPNYVTAKVHCACGNDFETV